MAFWDWLKPKKKASEEAVAPAAPAEDKLSGFLQYFHDKTEVQYTGDLYNDFLTQLGGRKFGLGLFNSFSLENVNQWNETVAEAYPEMQGRFKLFGYDWQGSCFGIDLQEKGMGNVLVFEIGTGEMLQTPCSLSQFLNTEIPTEPDAALTKSFFDAWRKRTKSEIPPNCCVGYKVPLFLGGEDELDNLEIIDMYVYWTILGQIRTQT